MEALFVISFIFFIVSLSGLYKGFRLLNNGKRTPAKILELIEEGFGEDASYYPVVEFFEQEKPIRMKLNMGRNKNAFAKGETITVVYPIGCPEQAVEFSFMQLFGFVIVIGGLSGYGMYYSLTEWLAR